MADLTSNVNVAAGVPERFDPRTTRGESMEAEHFARYRWAAQFAPGRRVLDAGCGVGYGTVLLAQAEATKVVGVDIAADVIADACSQADMSNIAFDCGDVTRLPYKDESFDLIVCFEVIEHLTEQDGALDEFRRILGSNGTLVLSSPNRATYPPGNPHHTHEYLPDELEAALRMRFAAVQLNRQHTWIGSAVLDDKWFAAHDETRLDDVHVHKLAGNEPGTELYTVALAGPASLPNATAMIELTAPVELRKWDQLWHEQHDVLHQQMNLLNEREELIRTYTADQERHVHELRLLRQQLASAEQELARVVQLDAKVDELTRLNDEMISLSTELSELRDTYTVVVQSSSWRLTRPLRQVAAALRKMRG